MDSSKNHDIKRDNKAKQLVKDFISFFENEYGIRHDAEGDLSLGEKADELKKEQEEARGATEKNDKKVVKKKEKKSASKKEHKAK